MHAIGHRIVYKGRWKAAWFAVFCFGFSAIVNLVAGHYEAAGLSFTTAWFAWCWADELRTLIETVFSTKEK